MLLENQKVNHITDGAGTIIAHYTSNNNIWVRFENGLTRMYSFPYDFYPNGVLSPSPKPLIDYVNNLPRFTFNHNTLKNQTTKNKNLNTIFNSCLSIFSDLLIPFDSSFVTLTINRKLKTTSSRTIISDGLLDSQSAFNYEIQINPKLLADNCPDCLLYQSLLNEMFYVAKKSIILKKGKWHQLSKTLSGETGYNLGSDNSLPAAEAGSEEPSQLQDCGYASLGRMQRIQA